MQQDNCYICGVYGPVHTHHIWMQSAGGTEGPVVNICATDHQKVHQMALNLESKTKEKVMLFSESEWVKAKTLVSYIVQAIRKNKNNPDFSNPATLQIKLTKYDIFLLHLAKEDAGYTNLNLYVSDVLKRLLKSKFPTRQV